MRTRIERKKKSAPAPATQRSIQRELSQAVGAGMFQHRDPLFHVAETFRQTFDRQGVRHAGEAAMELQSGAGFSSRENQETRESASGAEDRAEAPGKEKGRGPDREGAKNLPGTDVALHRFSDLAFQRGNLSASVLDGTGKMMLVSCLKQAVGQSDPPKQQMRTLFDTGSQRRNIPGRDPDQMLFNRSVAGSAVGIVVDTLRDARRVVQSMQEMAEGTGELKASEGGATLRTMYPFLDDSQERALLERYQMQLKGCSDGEERAALQNGSVHVRSLIDKKAQMKVEFISKLRFLSDRATETLAEFEAPGFVEQVAVLMAEEPYEPEPPEGDGEGGRRRGAGSADRPPDAAGPKNGGAADRTGAEDTAE